MRLSHARRAVSVRFDDPNLVSCGGLVAVVALATRCGLPDLLASQLTLAGKGAAHAAAKITALVAGMICGADCIDDMDLLRHGGMPRLFDQVRARPHWGRSCACSASVTSANSTPSPPPCSPGWSLRRRSCPARGR
jgi:hypothetical protein